MTFGSINLAMTGLVLSPPPRNRTTSLLVGKLSFLLKAAKEDYIGMVLCLPILPYVWGGGRGYWGTIHLTFNPQKIGA